MPKPLVSLLAPFWFFVACAVVVAVPAAQTAAARASGIVEADVWVAGEGDYHTYRIPSLATTPVGTVLAFCEGRKRGRGDTGDIDLLVRRSTDGGATFGLTEVLWDDGGNTCGNPCPVIDEETGTVWLLLTWNRGDDHEGRIKQGTAKDTRRVFVCSSTDDGVTWSTPREITATAKRPDWRWYATGPGVGIQLRRGEHAGRLVVPCDYSDAAGVYGSHVIFSDDGGRSWVLGGVVGPHTNECQIVERADGSLLLNMRNAPGSKVRERAIATSTDGGATWSDVTHDDALVEPVCQASLLRVAGTATATRPDVLLFANPATRGGRRRMTVRASLDGGRTWPCERLVYAGGSAYSCLTDLGDGQIGLLYERDGYGSIRLARFPLTAIVPPPSTVERPNVVVILADDLGWSDFGCYGGELDTPRIDALAASGIRFTQFYNGARCCPTRASLLTGLYAHQAGVGGMTNDAKLPGFRGILNDRCVTMAEVLGDAGYATWMAGKWHVTRELGFWNGNERLQTKTCWPRQRGFDRFWGTILGAGSFYDPITLVDDNEPQPSPSADADFNYTDAISARAVEWIEGRTGSGRQPQQPFFLYVAYTAPHWPLHARPDEIDRFRGRFDAGWDALRDARLARQRELGLVDPSWPLTARDPRVKAWEDVEHRAWQLRRMEVYAAQVWGLDRGIGRIVDALAAAGELDDTLLMVLADNGGCAEELGPNWKGLFIPRETRAGEPVQRGNDPSVMPGPETTYQSYGLPWANVSNTPFRRYKHFVHEGGISSPLIVHWPNGFAAENAIDHQPAHIVDVMATLVDVTGADYPSERAGHAIPPPEGVSLRRAFHGERVARRAPLFFEHEGNRAVRDGRWKLVARGKRGAWELYDMRADRTETNDLAKARPEIAARLAAAWEAWAKRAQVKPWPYR